MVSIIIPSYKKEEEITKQLGNLVNLFKRRATDYELIVIIDGDVDNTEAIVKNFKTRTGSNIKVFKYPTNRGKGFAIRYGMKMAIGDIIGFIDADNDIDLKTLDILLNAISTGHIDAVIPSKRHPASNVEMDLRRRILSYGYLFLNKIFIKLPTNIDDVSCGVKLFTKETVEMIQDDLYVNRFAIDTNILNEIAKRRLKVAVVPFYARLSKESTAANLKQSIKMLRDLLKVSLKGFLDQSGVLRYIDKYRTP